MTTASKQSESFTLNDILLGFLASAIIIFALLTGYKYLKNNEQLNNDLFVQNLQLTVGSETIDLRISSNQIMICLPKKDNIHMIECRSGD